MDEVGGGSVCAWSSDGTASSRAKKRKSGSAPRAGTLVARSPAVVRIVTESLRFRCATARDATSRMRRSKRAENSSFGALPGCHDSTTRVTSRRASRTRSRTTR